MNHSFCRFDSETEPSANFDRRIRISLARTVDTSERAFRNFGLIEHIADLFGLATFVICQKTEHVAHCGGEERGDKVPALALSDQTVKV